MISIAQIIQAFNIFIFGIQLAKSITTDKKIRTQINFATAWVRIATHIYSKNTCGDGIGFLKKKKNTHDFGVFDSFNDEIFFPFPSNLLLYEKKCKYIVVH